MRPAHQSARAEQRRRLGAAQVVVCGTGAPPQRKCANHDPTTVDASISPIDIIFRQYDPDVDMPWDVAED